MIILGPISSASREGAPWLFIIAGSLVLGIAWAYYFKRNEDANLSRYNLVMLTMGCALLIGIGVWQLLR
jgi:hypothetical protein